MRQAFFVAVTHIAIGGNALRIQNQLLVEPDVIPSTPPTTVVAPTPTGTATPTATTDIPAKTATASGTATPDKTAVGGGPAIPAPTVGKTDAKTAAAAFTNSVKPTEKSRIGKWKDKISNAGGKPKLPVIGLFWRVTH